MNIQTMSVGPAAREVHYYRAGKGEPLLYLHHLMGIAADEQALATLAERFDVIAPYAPGWGPAKDQLEEVDEGPLDLVLHQLDVLDAFEIERAHVCGISIGAWMAAELAAIAPHLVSRLALVNPLGLWLDDAVGEDPFAQHPGWPSKVLFADPDGRRQYLFEGRDKMDAHVEELLNLRAGAKFLWPIPDTGVARRLPRIKAPTLVVTSDKDVIVPTAHGAAWQRLIPGASLASLAGAGHIAEFDQPDAFARLVADFLSGEAIAAVA
jgi:pimeloyl-ACP methyl ester carboxylesterase